MDISKIGERAKKWLKRYFFSGLIAVAVINGIFFLLLQISFTSEAYKMAYSAVSSNAEIVRDTGGIVKVRKAPMESSETMSSENGEGHFKFLVYGKATDIQADVFLKKVEGVWSVTELKWVEHTETIDHKTN